MKKLIAGFLLALTLAGCGGGGGSSSPAASPTPAPAPTAYAANQVPVTVDLTFKSLNTPYVSVTVCAPGTSNCTTVDHVLVDTGSTGLRLLRSTLPASMGLATATDPNTGAPLAECAEFGSGHAWGPISTVDLKMGGEVASSLPMQIIDDSFATVPTDCAGYGPDMAANGATSMLANGIIGVSVLRRDCNSLCFDATSTIYYDCPTQTCTPAVMQFSQQLPNPVSRFANDNNGVVLQFPAVADGGAPSVTGTLTFGIDTQANNALGSAIKMNTTSGATVNATYQGQAMYGLVDSGSGAFFLPDSTIPQCPGSFSSLSWFCPASTVSRTASLVSSDNVTTSATFSIANAMSELGAGKAAHANNGVNMSLFGLSVLDLGMPYFYGKTIYFGIQSNDDLTAGIWPYFAVKS
jgi:hypothetical protein